MKHMYKNYLLILVMFMGMVPAIAQKYKAQSNNLIETSYQGHAFSSQKNLAENLEGLTGYSVFQELFASEAIQAIFAEDFMGTVFVLSDQMFNDESNPERSNLLAFPENKVKLVKFLVVPGRLDRHSMERAVSRGRGTTAFATLDGQKLQITKVGEQLQLTDEAGNTATIVGTNFYHKQGFFHLADGIVIPNSIK